MYVPIVNEYQNRTNEDYVPKVGDCNHTRAGHKQAHSLEVLLTHPTTKFFQVSTYFSGSSLCQIYAIWIFVSPRKSPKEQITSDASV